MLSNLAIRTLGTTLLAAAIASAPASAQAPAPVEALDGVDPVLLVQGKEVSGKPELEVVRGHFEYLFSSADTKAAFEREPSKYEIQLNGLCARMGKATGGSPSDYWVYDGKIYIFGSDECHKAFVANPKKYLPPATVPMPASARAASEGRALIDRAVKATGGAATIDPITTYVETASQIQKRPTGDVPVVLKTMWRFPDVVRLERTMTMPGKTMTSATLMNPAGMWFLAQGHAYPGIEAGRPSMELDFGRQVLPLLHARKASGLQAAALGSAVVEGRKVDRVRVRNGGVDVTLGLDPASGLIQIVSFVDRSTTTGEYGEYTILYSDYRKVGDLTLPFSERALFNGVQDDAVTRTIEAISINPALDRALFEPGPAGAR
jgi:YHS domain-containing protein